MKENLQLQKNAKMHGITLIALVVTIVVLLILAGITISLVFSENGIIAKAREAANKTNEVIINEQAQMNEVTAEMENMLNETGGSETTPEEPEGCPVEEFEKWNWTSDEKVNAVQSTDTTPITVPVPKGYIASKVTGETTVEDGFVIYEGTEEVNDANKNTAQKTRNQFVWVPVENPSEMYGRDEDCKKWGKLYDFDEDGITPLNWTEQAGVMSITNATGNREPDVITGNGAQYDAVNSNLQQAGLGTSATADTFKAQLETEFNSMITSAEAYGGFYIGRYETGNLSQSEAVVVKNNTDIASQTWYTMYSKSKGIAANSNVTTSMIWGCQWDAVMRWMYNSGDAEKKAYTYDSTGKGNYSVTGGNAPIPTGSNDVYAVNNIYDMAGNVFDWMIEAGESALFRTHCGGDYYSDGSDSPVSNRSYDVPTGSYDNDGSRLALYM